MVRYIQYFETRSYFFIFLIDLKIDNAIRFVSSNKSKDKENLESSNKSNEDDKKEESKNLVMMMRMEIN
jgi:hypothetical protein